MALAEQAEAALTGPRASTWMGRLDQEHENLRAALTWALMAGEDGRLEIAFRLCGLLCCFWWRRGYLSEGRRWVERTLSAPGNVTAALRAKVLHGAGILARARGDLAAAAALLEKSLAHWRAVNDTSGIAKALNSLGVVWFNQRDYDRAKEFFEASLTLHQALGDTPHIALALNNLGNIAYKNGDLQSATERYEESLSLLRGDHANQQTIALIKTNLGEIARLRKDYHLAAQLLHHSATIYYEINNIEGLILCLNNLIELAIDQDRAEFGARLLGAVDALYERIGAVRSPDLEIDYQRQITAIQRQIQPELLISARNQGNSTPIDVLLAQTIDTMRAEGLPKGVEL
jgi:tetratricopeptide (TPR) repeat protein